MKKYLIILIAGLGIFFLPHFSLAYTILDTTGGAGSTSTIQTYGCTNSPSTFRNLNADYGDINTALSSSTIYFTIAIGNIEAMGPGISYWNSYTTMTIGSSTYNFVAIPTSSNSIYTGEIDDVTAPAGADVTINMNYSSTGPNCLGMATSSYFSDTGEFGQYNWSPAWGYIGTDPTPPTQYLTVGQPLDYAQYLAGTDPNPTVVNDPSDNGISIFTWSAEATSSNGIFVGNQVFSTSEPLIDVFNNYTLPGPDTYNYIDFEFGNTGLEVDCESEGYDACLAEAISDGQPQIDTGSFDVTATPAPSLNFVFPVQGTSTGVFSNWVFSGSTLNTGDNYVANIGWIACPLGTSNTNSNCTTELVNNSAQYTGAQIMSSGFNIPRTEWSFDFAQNVTVYAIAGLYDLSTGESLTATSSINFTLLTIPNSSPSSTLSTGGVYVNTSSTGSGTYSVSTSTGYAAINAAGTSTITTWCPPPNALDIAADVGYGICQGINFLFNPNILPQGNVWFGNQVSGLEGVPPFVAFFQLASTTENGLNSYSTSSNPGVSIGILGYAPDNAQPASDTTIVVLNGTTFGQFNPTATSDALAFDTIYIDAWLWLAAGLRILWIFTHPST